jgi:hypothetical protein
MQVTAMLGMRLRLQRLRNSLKRHRKKRLAVR